MKMPKKAKGNRNWKLTRVIAAVLLSGTILSAPLTAFASKPQATLGPAFIELRHKGFSDVVTKVRPAVVSIIVDKSREESSDNFAHRGQSLPDDKRFREFFEKFELPREFVEQFDMPDGSDVPGQNVTAVGSGFFVSADGHIVTSKSVIENADNIRVRMHNGELINAKLIGADSKTDIAVLKVEGKNFEFVSFGNSDETRTGDWVVTLGNPFGLSGSVTAGLVSTLSRDVKSDPDSDIIQIDAAINRGNSGGPAFNTKGEVIGVNSLIYSPSGSNVGTGFAIASNTVNKVVNSLMKDNSISRGWLGVVIQPVTRDMASILNLKDAEGALIASVSDQSPAKIANLQPGDVVIGVDGKTIKSVGDLASYIADKAPETKISLNIWRNGEYQTKSIKLSRETNNTMAELKSDNKSDTKLGLALQNSDKGVIVADVEPDSSAAEKGLTKGDIIARVNQKVIENSNDVLKAISKAKERGMDRIMVLVKKQTGSRFVILNLSRA